MAGTQAAPLPPLGPGEFRFITNALTSDPSASADGPRRFRAVASSTITDLAGNTISPKALLEMRDDFRNGLTIFMDHDYTNVVDKVFGTSDSAEIVETGVKDKRSGMPIYDLVVSGPVNEPNPKAVQLHDSIRGGYVKFGASIGAIIRKHTRDRETGGMLIDSMNAKELSIVGIPKNQRSWAYKASVAAANLSEDEHLADDEPEEEEAIEVAEEQVVASNGEVLQQWVTPAGTGSVPAWDGVQTITVPDGAGIVGPITVFGDLSAKARDDLPASEFACPEKRLYPINDAAHVRAALSRVADPSNDQCGKSAILAAARKMGIGEHETKNSIDMTDEELLTWALTTEPDSGGFLVRQGICPTCGDPASCDCTTCDCAADMHGSQSSVTDGLLTAADDTPSETTPGGQEADVATPETAPAADDAPDPASEQQAVIATEDVAALVSHVKRLVIEVGHLREENTRLTEEKTALQASYSELSTVEKDATEAIRKVMALPLRRQAVGHVEAFVASYPGLDPRVSSYIDRATKEKE